MSTLVYTRKPWSFFAPPFTYAVTDDDNRWIGEVARNEGQRRWYASNKTWTSGGDLKQTFSSRWLAAEALRFIADGHDPERFGGYTPRDCS